MDKPAPPAAYGTTRVRVASVSFADIEAVARRLMASGAYASVAAVRKELKRGSTTTIGEAMRRFWKNQAALDGGNPVALTRLPPELADAAVDLWEQALRLSQQTVQLDDSAARAHIEHLRRDVDFRVRSVELREKEWDMAARVRERALSDAREQVGVLVGELAAARAELRSRDLRSANLEVEIEQLRAQLATVIAKAVARHRSRPGNPAASAASRRRTTPPPARNGKAQKVPRRVKRVHRPESRRGTTFSVSNRKVSRRRQR